MSEPLAEGVSIDGATERAAVDDVSGAENEGAEDEGDVAAGAEDAGSAAIEELRTRGPGHWLDLKILLLAADAVWRLAEVLAHRPFEPAQRPDCIIRALEHLQHAVTSAYSVAGAFKELAYFTPEHDLHRALLNNAKTYIRDLICWRVHRESAPRSQVQLQSALEVAFGGVTEATVRSQLLLAFPRVLREHGLEPSFPCDKPSGKRKAHAHHKRRGQRVLSKKDREAKPRPSPQPPHVYKCLYSELEQWTVRNTFIDFDVRSQNTTRLVLSEPGHNRLRRRVARLSASTLRDTCCAVSVATCDPGSVEDGSNHQPDMQPMLCSDCNIDDPEGWEDRRGDFYCTGCWHRWRQWEKENEGDDAEKTFGRNVAHQNAFGNMDPVATNSRGHTQVHVVLLHCIDAARQQKDLKSLCLVTFGSEIHMHTSPTDYLGIQSALGRASNFGVQADLGCWAVPRRGGVLVENTTFGKSYAGEAVEEFTIPVVYAPNPYGPELEGRNTELFRSEFEQKVANVLRKCWSEGFLRLIVGSRFTQLPLEVVAELFWKCLFGETDTAGLFAEVTFAFADDDSRAVEAHQVFSYFFHDPS